VSARHPRALLAAVLALGLAACGGSSGPPASAPRASAVLAAILDAAGRETAPWRCAARDTPEPAREELSTGEARWQVAERTLARVGDDREVVIGVVADAAGSAPKTIASLGRLRGQLDAAAPDLVITLGGMGRTPDQLAATLGTLGDRATWPVVALPGDLEATSAHVAAIATLRQRGAIVLDGRLVRWIQLPGATIGTLPGAGARERLVAGWDGCAWRADDVALLYAELTARPGVRVVASAEAPRQMIDGEPAGELALVPPMPIEVALHGPLHAGASKAVRGGRDGARVVLSPGTADGTTRLPAHVPSAGLLVIRDGTWSWRPLGP
jgi:hypothetical protein